MNVTGVAMHGHTKPVTMVKFNTEGDLLFSTVKEPVVTMWDGNTGERLGTFGTEGEEGKPKTLHSATAGCDVNYTSTMLATAGSDFKTQIWRIRDGERIGLIEHRSSARTVGFSHDDRQLMVVIDKRVTVRQGTIELFNLPYGQRLEAPEGTFNACATYETPEAITFAEWGPTNDTIYFGSADGSVSILDVETQKEINCGLLHKDTVNRLHFDKNYHTLVTASSDRTAMLLDSRDLRKPIQVFHSDVPVNDASISPCGDHVILGGGIDAQSVTTQGGTSVFEVKFYHKVFGDLLGSMKCHFGTINTVQYHPDGRSFASGAHDGLIKLNKLECTDEKAPGVVPLWTPSADVEA